MTRGTQKVLLALFKNVLYNAQQSCLEQMKSLWKQSWANCNAQELRPPEHGEMLSQPILKLMLQCCAGLSPFISHLGHNLKIYATMRCSIIQLYWRTVSQQKVNAGKKKLERNGTAFVLSSPVHFFFTLKYSCFCDMFQQILLVSFDKNGTIRCSSSYGIHMKITWFVFVFFFLTIKNNQKKKVWKE